MQMDGDKTAVFHDIDGSVSEYPGAFLVKEDNWLLRHPDCIDVPDWKAAICSGHYAQVGQQVSELKITFTDEIWSIAQINTGHLFLSMAQEEMPTNNLKSKFCNCKI